jgi:predicted metal-binding membrane protein
MSASTGSLPIGPSRWRRPRTPLERGQLAVLIVLALLTVAAWGLTIRQAQMMDMPMGIVARDPMPDSGSSTPATMDDMSGMAMDEASEVAASGMVASGWSLAAFSAFVVAWAVMMAAMMFPSAAPMILLFRTVARQRRASGSIFVPTWIFVTGYLLVWTAVGAITWVLVQWLSDIAGQFGAAERATWAPIALGAVLIVASLYQLTPLKRVCLDHCRSPFAFVMQHWHEGYGGALRMGIEHGAYCLGCCWALFAVLVAAGVMSLAWMLVLTLVIFAEKVLPLGRRASYVAGAAFLILGVVVASGVSDLPGVV